MQEKKRFFIWNFGQILMDNRKLVVIHINKKNFSFQTIMKMQFLFFLYKICMKILEFGRMHTK
jgi:hypothetical protein